MSGDLFFPTLAENGQFDQFYRSRVNHKAGARIKAADLREAYNQWAQRQCAPGISFRQLRQEMELRGHRHFYSNGARYCDAEVSAISRGVDADASSLSLAARLDAVMRELGTLVGQLAHAAAHPPPRSGADRPILPSGRVPE